MKVILLVAMILAATPAARAEVTEGTFRCANAAGLPDNVYSVRNMRLDGVNVPYVEINRFYRGSPGNQVEEVKIRGFAAVSEAAGSVTLMLAAVRLEFESGKLTGCKQNP